ncbi:MAG: DUF6089 family protein [Draconibacterium sp.]
MKRLALVFAIVLMTVSGHAQKTADIGIWGGTSTVWGDMDNNAAFETFNPTFGAYFRYNFNARVALRAMFLTGNMSREGTVEGAPWSFDKSAQDLTLQAEINYLKYILGKKKLRFSPYVTIGVGVSYFSYTFLPEQIYAFNPDYSELAFDPNTGALIVQDPAQEESEVVPTIPFGFGFKYTIGERLGLGVEYQMRKYMSDRLDDLDDPLAYRNSVGEVVSYNQGSHNNDWVGYLGILFTYKIYIGKKACPAYESKQ